MKKKFFLLLLFFAFSVLPAQSFAAIIGNNYAQKDVNVRISPHASAQRIGHFKKGQKIIVKKIMGTWCHVEYKKYRNAYVYCPLLKNGTTVEPLKKADIKPLTFDEISLDYPKSWQINTAGMPPTDMMSISKINGPNISSIIVMRTELNSETEAKKQTEEFFKILDNSEETKKQLDQLGLKIISQEQLNVPVGKEFYKTVLVVANTLNGSLTGNTNESTYIIGTLVVKGKNMYTVFGISEKNNEDLTEVKNIIQTFKVK